jgi:hypothetical protein
VAQPEDGISHVGIFPRINDYDKWAIQWGYSPMFGAADEDEDHKMLEPLTVRAQTNPHLWWGDGESGEGHADPRRQTEDLGDDPVKASLYGIQNLKRELKNLPQWTLDNNKDLYWQDLQTMYVQIRTQFLRYCGHVTRNIGGRLINFREKGSDQPVYQPQPLERQKAALKFLDEQVLQEPLWLRDLSYASRISDYPQVLTTVVGESVVSNMMNRLESLNELYTPQAYLTDLSKLVFAEADSHKKVTPYRMTLQNTMFQHLQRALGNGNTQVRPAVLYTLQQLQKKFKAASQSAPDLESRAHWANLYDQAGRLLSWD